MSKCEKREEIEKLLNEAVKEGLAMADLDYSDLIFGGDPKMGYVIGLYSKLLNVSMGILDDYYECMENVKKLRKENEELKEEIEEQRRLTLSCSHDILEAIKKIDDKLDRKDKTK